MKLKLARVSFQEKCTVGELFCDGERTHIYTLEDKLRLPGEKVYGETAIPPGIYKVIVDFSQRFQREMPHVLNVPGFQGIRIHPGNSDVDTEGCILVGYVWNGLDFIGGSHAAFDVLFEQIKKADAVELEIV